MMRLIYLLIVATIGIALIPIGLLYSFVVAFFSFSWNPIPKLSRYLHSLGLSLSRLLNVTCCELFDDIAIQPGGHKFGDHDETTSSVLGKNQDQGTLKPIGEFMVKMLDKVDPGHAKDAAGIS